MPKGKGATKLINSWPDKLSQELLAVVRQQIPAGSSKRVVLDLCSGWQSLKPLVLAAGFDYVAVDVKGDRNLGRAQTKRVRFRM